MKHNFKKILSIILAAVICLTAFPFTVFAETAHTHSETPAAAPNCPTCHTNVNVTLIEGREKAELSCTTPSGYWYVCNAVHADTNQALEFVLPDEGSVAHHSNIEKLTWHPAVEANCNTEAVTAHWDCSECDGFYAGTYTDDEHFYVSTVTIANPYGTIDEDAHDWTGIWVETTAPVCGVSDGEETLTCLNGCGATQTRPVDKDDHEWVVQTVTGGETCLDDGTITFVCDNCGATTKEYFANGWNHELVKTEAVGSDCDTKGEAEYWTCRQCGKFFADANAETEIAKDSWIGVYTHNLTHVIANDPTCTDDGNIEYYECDCGKKFASEADAKTNTYLTTDVVIPANGHDVEEKGGVEVECTTDGSEVYYDCKNCDLFFEDEDATVEIADGSWVITATGHVKTHHDAVIADCDTEGVLEHYTCANCDGYYVNADNFDDTTMESVNQPVYIPNPEWVDGVQKGDMIVFDPNDPLGGGKFIIDEDGDKDGFHQHIWVGTVNKANSCDVTGVIKWTCDLCEEFDTEDAVIFPAIGHKNHTDCPDCDAFEGVEATCVVAGVKAHTYCPDCGCYFELNVDGTIKEVSITDICDFVTGTVANAHPALDELTESDKTAAKDPTCDEDGNIEYYTCPDCGEFFVVENGEYVNKTAGELVLNKHTQTTVPAETPVDCMTLTYGAYVECSCGKFYAVDDTDFSDPKTNKESFVNTPDHIYTYVARPVDFCGKGGLEEHYVCGYDCGKYFDMNKEETTYDELMKEADGNHNFTVTTPATPCQLGTSGNPGFAGVAGIETCTGCGTTRAYDQHNYSIKVYVTHSTCDDFGTYKLECSICHNIELTTDNGVLTEKIYIADEYRTHFDVSKDNILHTPRVESTCFEDGNVEYWTCSHCGKNFADAAYVNELATVVIPAEHKNVSAYDERLTDVCGTVEVDQFFCDECDKYSLTADFAELKDTPYTAPATSHNGALVSNNDYQAPTCLTDGHKETFTCQGECKKTYIVVDAAYVEATETNVVITKNAHDGTFVPYVAPTCNTTGNWAYFTACSDCGKIYGATSDEATENGVVDENKIYETLDATVIAKIAHAYTKVDATAPMCQDDGTVEFGNIEYFYCDYDDCGKIFLNLPLAGYIEVELDDTVIEHTSSYSLVANTTVAPTCTTKGYYALGCSCGHVYYQFTAPLLHNVTEKNETAVEAKCSATGMHKYYYCVNCDKSYTDADCTVETAEVYRNNTDATIPATGIHRNASGVVTPGCSLGVNRICDECDGDFTVSHTMNPASVDASCMYSASTYLVCGVCGWIDESSRIITGEPSGIHPTDALAYEVLEPATCTEDGSARDYCKLCGQTIQEITLTATDHDMVIDATKTEIPATCVDNGTRYWICANECGYTYEETLEATGAHTEGVWVLNPKYDGKANYTVDDAMIMYCAVDTCGAEIGTQPMQDIKFSASIDNAVVAGAELVNSGKLAVTIKVSAFEKAANTFQLTFNYSDNLIFDEIVWGDLANKFGYVEGSGKDGVCTLFTMRLAASDVKFGDLDEETGFTYADDAVYATIYFDIIDTQPDAINGVNTSVEITNIKVNQMLTIEDDITASVTNAADVADEVAILGDANADGKVDLKDVQLLMTLATNPTSAYNACADFDKDGKVLPNDFAAIRKFFAGTYDYAQLVNPDLRPAA